MRLFCRQPHLLGKPFIRAGSGHMLRLPVRIKNVMGLNPLQPQSLIGHVSQRAFCSFMAAHPCIAVLALVDALTAQPQALCRFGAIDPFRRNQKDQTSAVSADFGFIQLSITSFMPPSKGQPLSFSSFPSCFLLLAWSSCSFLP